MKGVWRDRANKEDIKWKNKLTALLTCVQNKQCDVAAKETRCICSAPTLIFAVHLKYQAF